MPGCTQCTAYAEHTLYTRHASDRVEMNQKSTKSNEHYDNYMAISKVLSLLKTLPCDTVENLSDIKCTRRMLQELQMQEWKKDNPNIILEVS